MIVGQACHWVYDRINRMCEEEAYFPRLQGLDYFDSRLSRLSGLHAEIK